MLDSLHDKKATSIVGVVLTLIGLGLQYFSSSFNLPPEVSIALIAVGTALANLGKALVPAKPTE